MPRKRKTTKLMGSADLRSIHYISVEANRNVYDRLSHYLLAVHHLGTWLEQAWINLAEYRRLEKNLAKRYGFSDKSILCPNVRGAIGEMNEQQIATVVQLRFEDYSSSAIAEITGISINTIKSYSSRHGIPAPRHVRTCLLCHAEVTLAQRFCSDACRLEWYESHQNDVPELLRLCKTCGAVFELRQQNQEYCSKQFFYTDRYHQKPKADKVTVNQHLMASVLHEAAVAIVSMTVDYLKNGGWIYADNDSLLDPSCVVDAITFKATELSE